MTDDVAAHLDADGHLCPVLGVLWEDRLHCNPSSSGSITYQFIRTNNMPDSILQAHMDI